MFAPTTRFSLGAAFLMLAAPVFAEDIRSSVDEDTLANDKKTDLGLYLTAEDAHRALLADPDIVFIDVRDPNEADFVGHPTSVDAIVPLLLATHAFVAEEGSYAMARNDAFIAEIGEVIEREGASPQSQIFVMCRSGARGAAAVDELAQAGYENVWNLVQGFQGEKDDEGARNVNGWRTADLPWTYDIDPQTAWTPSPPDSE